MSLTVTHPFVSLIADAGDTSLVRPSDWNNDHTVVGDATATAGYVLTAEGAGAAPTWSAGREVLTASRTYYVRTDGSNSNDGLSNTASGAFLTPQYAANVVSALDINGKTVTIQIADGTYGNMVWSTSTVGGGTVVINGNSATPTNVMLRQTGASAVGWTAPSNTVFSVTNMRLGGSSTRDGLDLSAAVKVFWSGVDFAAVTSSHVSVGVFGSAFASGAYTISDGAGLAHLITSQGKIFINQQTITISGTPAITYFAFSTRLGLIEAELTSFAGTGATGTRYYVDSNSVINTGGGGAAYFPGSIAGTATTGGQYI